MFNKQFELNAKHLREYEYKYSLDNTFKFQGLSYTFICTILENHAYRDTPWKNETYKVIYGQLLYFYFIDLFISITNNNSRNSLMSLLKNYIQMLLHDNLSNKNNNMMANSYKKIINKHGTSNSKFILLIKKINAYRTIYKEQREFIDYLRFIQTNITIFTNVFNSVYSYCNKGNEIFEENIYSGSISNMI